MSLVTRSVLRRSKSMWKRLALIALVIAWAMGMFVAGPLASDMMSESIDSYVSESRMPDVFIDLEEGVPEQDLMHIVDSSGDIGATQLRAKVEGRLLTEDGWMRAIVYGVDDPGRQDVGIVTIVEGDVLSDTDECMVVTGPQVSIGDTLTIAIGEGETELELVGSFTSPEFMIVSENPGSVLPIQGSMAVLYVPMSTVESMGYVGINDVSFLVAEDGDEDAAIAAFNDLSVISVTRQADTPSVQMMDMGARKMDVILPSISIVFMAIGALSIFMTVFKLMSGETRQIGVLMAMGVRRRTIGVGYMTMGVMISAIGIPIGCLVAILFASSINSVIMQYFGDVPMATTVGLMPFLYGALLVIAIVSISVAVPIYLTLRKDVRSALTHRPRTTVHESRLGRRLPKTLTMGMRNFLREPARMTMVVLIVALTIGTAGSWMVMDGSAIGYMDDQLASDRWDVKVGLDGMMGSGEAIATFTTDSTSRVTPYVELVGTLTVPAGGYGATVLATDDMASIRDFDLREGELDFSGAVMANTLFYQLDVDIGDVVTFDLAGSSVELVLTGVVNDLMISTVYTDRGNLDGLIGPSTCQGVLVEMVDGGDAEAYSDLVMGIPGVSFTIVSEDLSASLASLMGDAMAFFYAFFVINMGMALVVASSAVIITTMERDMEFATMMSLGVRRRGVVASILIEVAALALVSSIVAIPMSYMFATLFAGIVEEAVFYFPIHLEAFATLLTFLLGFAFVWMSAIAPIRYSGRLDIDEAIRERDSG